MKRNLLVPTVEKAIEMMRSFLASQLIETEIERDGDESAPYFVKLVWLSRDLESDDWMGCPCFVADFHGKASDGNSVRGIVYVKCFPTQTTQVTKMKIIEESLDYKFYFIEDGENFKMHDDKCRYEDEVFAFTNGQIVKLK